MSGNPEYLRYTNSPEWEWKKREYWKKYGRSCRAKNCTSQENLEIHHHTYCRLGDEKLEDLVALCKIHHQRVHEVYRRNKRLGLTKATEIVTGLSLKRRRKKLPREVLEDLQIQRTHGC
jgi:hypothetical protein